MSQVVQINTPIFHSTIHETDTSEEYGETVKHSTCLCAQAADSPHMLSVPMTWVKEGGMVRLDKKYLRADYKGVSSDDVVYIIHTADGQPKYGNK